MLLLGDVIDDGDLKVEGVNRSERQYAAFEKHFGLDGRDGLLKYPVFETWGNHDGPPVGAEKNGFSFQANLKRRNAVRARKGLVSRVSENGLHCSWDWDDVHFVQLGIYPADRQREGIRYSPVWHDPQNALSFLKRDLAETVGKSGRPVVLMSHTGFDSDWWVPADWAEFYEAVKPYNVVLYLYGHSGTGVRQWAPEGEPRKLLCLNTGQTENGYFVVRIRDNRMRFGYRAKQWEEAPGAPPSRTWTGAWAWRWAGQAEITPRGAARVRWEG